MKLTVEGVTCLRCVSAIARVLEGLGARADVDLAAETVTVYGTDDVGAVGEAIERNGYTVGGVTAFNAKASPDAVAPSRCCGSCKT